MNDVRLGDLDALEHEFMTKRRYLDKDQVLDAAYIINKATTIDAVPVVRCRECKEYRTLQAMTYYKNGVHIRCCPCERTMQLRKDDDFCSYGERKDGDA